MNAALQRLHTYAFIGLVHALLGTGCMISLELDDTVAPDGRLDNTSSTDSAPPNPAPFDSTPNSDALTDFVFDSSISDDMSLPDACLNEACNTELCNGMDDDGDSIIDEGVTNACGACGIVAVESCDNIDNDCDGLIDESLSQTCGSNIGVCVAGAQTCIEGSWTQCAGNETSATETCDNLDNDCDGTIDEALSQSCGSDVGLCQSGIETCSDGTWGNCVGQTTPVEEHCNEQDNDCDGNIDEMLVRNCGTDVGACQSGRELCENGQWNDCTDGIEPIAETCDSVDNDCDGAVDEDYPSGPQGL